MATTNLEEFMDRVADVAALDDIEDSSLGNLRRSLAGDRMIKIMLDNGTRKWPEWIQMLLDDHAANRQRYLDEDCLLGESAVLTGKRNDKWLNADYLNSAKTRRFIRNYVTKHGYYIRDHLDHPRGIYMTSDPGNISRGVAMQHRKVGTMCVNENYKVNNLVKRGMALPIVVPQVMELSGD